MRHFKIILPLATLLSLSLLWTACFKDNFTGSNLVATVTFAGRILDESGQPISDAQVRAGGELAMTDKNGVFRLSPVSLPADNAILKVNKIGYFDFSRAYVVEHFAVKPVTIQLLKKVQIGAFAASTGGTVQVPGGAQLIFPAGAVAYSGQVRVFARYLDPTDAQLPLFMPGDLRGINAGGEEQSLSTFGMLAVEMLGQANEELQLAVGSEAEITVPIPGGQAAAAPAELPLWHYDNDQARWIEEGKAQKIGDWYVGKVKHFSYWNYDASAPSIILSGKVYLEDKQHPLAGVGVWVVPVGSGVGWGCGHGETDGNGCFKGAVTKDIALKILIYHYASSCGTNAVYATTVGPFSDDAALSDIVLSTLQLQAITVSGRLTDCNNQPVAKGYVRLEASAGAGQVGFPDATGKFDFTFLNCTSISTAEVKGYDLTAELESPAQTAVFPPNTVSLGDISVCQNLSEFIKYTLDGTAFTIVDPGGESNNQTTFIAGENALQHASIAFSFTNAGQTGTFPLNFLNINQIATDSSSVANLNTTLTSWGGQPGQFSVGTFGGIFQDWTGQSHTVSGSYRVKR